MAGKKSPYKDLNQELEEILAKLQSQDLDIDEAIKIYERATVVIKELEDYIKTAGNKVKKIKAGFLPTKA